MAGMTASEGIAFGIFIVITIAFAIWVIYLAVTK